MSAYKEIGRFAVACQDRRFLASGQRSSSRASFLSWPSENGRRCLDGATLSLSLSVGTSTCSIGSMKFLLLKLCTDNGSWTSRGPAVGSLRNSPAMSCRLEAIA